MVGYIAVALWLGSEIISVVNKNSPAGRKLTKRAKGAIRKVVKDFCKTIEDNAKGLIS
jgi:hypothetical protein